MNHQDEVNQLKKAVEESNRIVFFGGAGVSTESGIPDFRSVDGLYNQKYDYPPEKILSHTFFIRHTEEFYRFYREKILMPKAEPNITHKTLARLEAEGKLSAIVTQNIDNLHQRAGSRVVYELHGSAARNYCMKCGKFFDGDYVRDTEGVPHCECGGIIKPDVVLYEEGLNDDTVEKAITAIAEAEVLIIGGTSLSVYPAAGMVRYFRGNTLVLINKSVTPMDKEANILIHAGLGETFSQL